jgi:MFS transporter, DHA2 family, multidrug resistance protein
MSQSTPAASAPEASPAAAGTEDKPLLEVRHRGVLLFAVMLISICQFLDATIANVALPHMKTALGASTDTVTWVLTSFIIATAVFTPITGWLSDRVGSRNLFLWSTVAFLVASALCGAAQTLPEMVAFRVIQGTAAAFIGPLTMTIMFDVSAPSKQAMTMGIFSMIVMVAPISGPTIGGFLTEYLSWRWIFYVNLPIGIPALVLLWWLLPSRPVIRRRLDLFGFASIALALGAMQLVLDRGHHQDWFDSWEIIIETIVAISFLWIFVIHSRATAHPLFNRGLYQNRNFMLSIALMAIMGLAVVGLSAVLPMLFQTIYGYPVIDTGLMMAPRGVGVMISSLIAGWAMKYVDARVLMSFGFAVASWSMWTMTTWTIEMDVQPILIASFFQGIGFGAIVAPMNLIAFATLHPALRPDGSSLMALFRSLGGSIGISVIVSLIARNQQVSHADLGSNVTGTILPTIDLPAMVDRVPGIGEGIMALIDGEVSRQALMIAYLDNFYLLTWILIAFIPLPFLLKNPRKAPPQSLPAAA